MTSVADISIRERLALQVIARAKLPLAEERAELEGSLISFVEGAWPSLDPTDYQRCWAIDALCEHLQFIPEVKQVAGEPLAGQLMDKYVYSHPGHRWLKEDMSKDELQKIQDFYRQRYGAQNEPK